MIDFNTLPLVAKPSMNQTHYEEVEHINKVLQSLADHDTQAVTQGLQALQAHTQEHFSGEEAMMREHHFPPYAFHKAEHDNALIILEQALRSWETAHDEDAMSHFLEHALAAWLRQHIQSMDHATAMFLESVQN